MADEFARIPGQLALGEEVAVAGGKATRSISFTFGAADEASANGDFIPRDELAKAAERLNGQAIDLLHNFPLVIGSFTSPVKFVEQGTRTMFGGDGNLWAWRYPEEVAAIADAFPKGMLEGSMEMGAEHALCSECGHDFGPIPGTTYQDLYDHRKAKHEGKGHRILRDLDPRGAAVIFKTVDRGAYAGTQILALASRRREEMTMADEPEGGDKGKQTAAPPTIDPVALAAQVGKLQQQYDELNKQHDLTAKERDELKARIAEMDAKAAIAAKESERVTAFTATLKEKNPKAALTDEQMVRLRERARTQPDEGWQAFSEDWLLTLGQTAASGEVAQAGRSKGADPPVPGSGGDEKPPQKRSALQFALLRSSPHGQVAVASRKDAPDDDDAGGDDDA